MTSSCVNPVCADDSSPDTEGASEVSVASATRHRPTPTRYECLQAEYLRCVTESTLIAIESTGNLAADSLKHLNDELAHATDLQRAVDTFSANGWKLPADAARAAVESVRGGQTNKDLLRRALFVASTVLEELSDDEISEGTLGTLSELEVESRRRKRDPQVSQEDPKRSRVTSEAAVVIPPFAAEQATPCFSPDDEELFIEPPPVEAERIEAPRRTLFPLEAEDQLPPQLYSFDDPIFATNLAAGLVERADQVEPAVPAIDDFENGRAHPSIDVDLEGLNVTGVNLAAPTEIDVGEIADADQVAREASAQPEQVPASTRVRRRIQKMRASAQARQDLPAADFVVPEAVEQSSDEEVIAVCQALNMHIQALQDRKLSAILTMGRLLQLLWERRSPMSQSKWSRCAELKAIMSAKHAARYIQLYQLYSQYPGLRRQRKINSLRRWCEQVQPRGAGTWAAAIKAYLDSNQQEGDFWRQ